MSEDINNIDNGGKARDADGNFDNAKGVVITKENETFYGTNTDNKTIKIDQEKLNLHY